MDVVLDGLFRQNDSYDYDANYEYKDSSEEKGSEAVWIPVLLSVVLIVGLLGNVLVLAALVLRRQRWSMSDTFILHLAVADILLLMTLPFWAAQTAQHCGWCSEIFCKIRAAAFTINFCCGIFLLVGISLDHCLSSARVVRLHSHKIVHISCCAVWLISVLFTIPDWLFVGQKEDEAGTTQCVYNYPESSTDTRMLSRLVYLLLCFLLPTVVLIMCWSYILQHSSDNLFRQRRVTLILPLVVAFLLCWMPYNITLFVDTFYNRSLKGALTVTSALACVHACLRPPLYLVLRRNFRGQILSLLSCATFDGKGSLWELAVDEEVPHEQAQSEDELKQMTCGEDHVQSVQS